MIRAFILTVVSVLFLQSLAKGQYINTDTLNMDIYHFPALVSELDSLEIYSPEITPDYFISGHVTTGYLLAKFQLPATGKVISRFGPRSGRMHTGTDVKKAKGDTIYAAYYGQVTMSKYYHGYGNLVVLDHGNNLETYYSHLSKCLVKPGENIIIGQPVGLAGATGRATTSHLHFEIRENHKPYDSELVFDFENGLVRDHVAKTENLAALHKEMKPKGYSVNAPVSQNYIVRAGDSLYKIARRTSTTITTLCHLNNITESTVLRIGQVLKVYE